MAERFITALKAADFSARASGYLASCLRWLAMR
jgi:hypothetical protein